MLSCNKNDLTRTLIGINFETYNKRDLKKEEFMKKMLLMAILTISTVAFAQVKEGKVANRAQSREFLQTREEYKKYEQAVKSGKMTETIKKSFTKFLNDSMSGLSGIKADGLESLTNINVDSASKIVELITLAKNGTVEQKAKALNDLKIMSDGALLIDSSSAKAMDEAKALEQISEMSDYNENAKNFKTELAKQLKLGGISVSDAITKASKGKITLEKIKDCII